MLEIQTFDPVQYRDRLLEYRSEAVGAIIAGIMFISIPAQFISRIYSMLGLSSADAVALSSESFALLGHSMVVLSIVYFFAILGLNLISHLQQMNEE